jgi:Ni/Fe-hydrogenase subunit HybB-like protein
MTEEPARTKISTSKGPWKLLGVIGNVVALVMAILVTVLWGREIVPDILRRSAAGYDVVFDIAFFVCAVLLGLGFPMVGIVLAAIGRRWSVGCGCTAAVVSVLGALAAGLLLLGLSGVGAH